jgi:hypothetical protein
MRRFFAFIGIPSHTAPANPAKIPQIEKFTGPQFFPFIPIHLGKTPMLRPGTLNGI